MIADVERAVARKARNRKRREREHLEQARHEPPRPYRRTLRRRREWHGVETPPQGNRKTKRGGRGHYLGRLPSYEATAWARGERHRQRAHVRRMARR